MILETLVNWFMNMLDSILDMAFKPVEWMMMHLSYIVTIADVWGYLNSFVNLGVIAGLIGTIVIFDNLNFILSFLVGFYDKIRGS